MSDRPQKLETVWLARSSESDLWTYVYPWSVGHMARAGNEVARFVRVPEDPRELVEHVLAHAIVRHPDGDDALNERQARAALAAVGLLPDGERERG